MSTSPEAKTPKLPDLPPAESSRPSSTKPDKESQSTKGKDADARADSDNKLGLGGVDEPTLPALPPYTPPAPSTTPPSQKKGDDDELEQLRKRFEALRKR